ncbi:response regulator [Paucisalibacillus sp. EB02]|uniref:response regulator transcription factor n=1 Tax=Paucisalibacillus sp. EB02 TaxID=1347087 RepID=UPI0004AD6FF5|nr:response regulator [Paucisalibacillus sp. EB02]
MFSILIVDDEWTIREGLQRTVPWGDWGIDVIGAATNGYEALEILVNSHVDILLTDIRMPAMNGLELIDRCRTLFPGLKMVLLTGHDEFEYAQKAIKLGADDFLLKPTNINELKATMLSITSELRSEQQEKDALITLLIKDIIEHNSVETITKLKAQEGIHSRFGFIMIRYKNEKPYQLMIDHVHLIEDKVGQQVYFCHSIPSEEHWDEMIKMVKDNFEGKDCKLTLHVSLLTDELEQLVNSFKQARSASDTYYDGKNITIYKYHDEKYTMRFEEVIRYIHRHYQEAISQSVLAEKLNMSNSYFSKLFKQHTNMNFVDYITSKRIEEAKQLLHSTTLKTYEIAHEVGYTESRYFSQLFKKFTGQTPVQYREQSQTNEDN